MLLYNAELRRQRRSQADLILAINLGFAGGSPAQKAIDALNGVGK